MIERLNFYDVYGYLIPRTGVARVPVVACNRRWGITAPFGAGGGGGGTPGGGPPLKKKKKAGGAPWGGPPSGPDLFLGFFTFLRSF